MRYKLEAYSIKEFGQRANQEDSMFPEMGNATNNDRLFILCDGMGGHEKGEVASQTVCEAMGESVMKQCPDAEGVFTDEILQKALSDALDALDKKDDGSEKKMGTTMTFLKLHKDGATIAHIGDSRVYHIRSGATAGDTKILFQTCDHSLVNDLVKSGNLTPEEAKNFERKNVITRAMQPNLERRPRADIYHTDDIKAGDYFMLCSDGILEQMEDENIRFIFSGESPNIATDADRVEMIRKVTADNKDNHTAFIIHISEVEGAPVKQSADDDDSDLVPLTEPTPVPEKAMAGNSVKASLKDKDREKQKEERNKRFVKDISKHLGVALGVAVLLVLVFFVLVKFDVIKMGQDEEQPEQEQTEQPVKLPANNKNQGAVETVATDDTNTSAIDDVAGDIHNAVEQKNNETDINNAVTAFTPTADDNNSIAVGQEQEAQPSDTQAQEVENKK